MTNRVQLIGLICKQPRPFEHDGRQFVRLLIEVDEKSEEESVFSSYHPVVLLEEVAYAGGDICVGDYVMVEGRLNNWVFMEEGIVKKRGTNVQAHSYMLLRKSQAIPQVVSEDSLESVNERIEKIKESNVYSIFSARSDDVVDDEPPF